MNNLKKILLTLVLVAGVTQLFSQITTARLQLISPDGLIEFTPGQNVNGNELSVSDVQFKIVDGNKNEISGFEVSGGDVLVTNGTDDLKSVGAITAEGTFDAVAKAYLAANKDEKLIVQIFGLYGEEKQEQKLNFTLYLNLTTPSLFVGNIANGSTPDIADVINQNKVELKNYNSPNVISYRITSGIVSVEGIELRGEILANGMLDENAKSILSQSAGKQVTFLVSYHDSTDGNPKRTALVFTTKD